MELDEAKELLENAGYIVENAISFKQEAENIVYSYGTDEYGLDVYQIVNIMEDASKIKGRYEQTDFITNQIKKITGLSIWDIENNENLQAAHFDICITVYKKTSQRKQNDNLDEAKKILKNAGYIIESSMSLKDKIDNAKKFNSNIDKMKKDAVNIFKQVFHEDEVTDNGDGTYKIVPMSEYDIEAIYKWDDNDTLSCKFDYSDNVLTFKHLSRHLNYDPKGGPWQEGEWSGDEELENFISDLAFEYQNAMSY